MNNWGQKSIQWQNSREGRRIRAGERLERDARRRRALIDDEDACPETHGWRGRSFDGFCREQQLRIEAVFGASVARVRVAQMVHNEEGYDDDIPRTPQYRCQISR